MVNENGLSKEELEALLGTAKEEKAELTKEESGVIKDVSTSSMNAAAIALSTILNKQVEMSSPRVKTIAPMSIGDEIKGKAIVVEVEYSGGIVGPTYLLFLKNQGAIIADLMMGGNGTAPPEEINDLYMGALGEALGQMMDSAATSLSTTMGQEVKASTPKIKIADFTAGTPGDLSVMREDQVVKVDYNLTLGNLGEGKVIQLLPMQIAKPIVNSIIGTKPTQPAAPAPVLGPGVHPVQFSSLKPASTEALPPNIKMIMDVPMDVSVEIGRKRMSVKEILNITTGTIVEVDKLVGEPVDIRVNGKLIAKGGVVVVDESFGVRITEILTPGEMIETLG